MKKKSEVVIEISNEICQLKPLNSMAFGVFGRVGPPAREVRVGLPGLRGCDLRAADVRVRGCDLRAADVRRAGDVCPADHHAVLGAVRERAGLRAPAVRAAWTLVITSLLTEDRRVDSL